MLFSAKYCQITDISDYSVSLLNLNKLLFFRELQLIKLVMIYF